MKKQPQAVTGRMRRAVDWLTYLEQQKQAGLIQGYTATEPPVKEKRKNKYGAVRTEVDGIWFDSVKEAGWYVKLRYLERAGEIQDLRLQVPFQLIEPNGEEIGCRYVADFTYLENGVLVVADAKSPATRKIKSYVIKRKLMLSIHGIKIKEL